MNKYRTYITNYCTEIVANQETKGGIEHAKQTILYIPQLKCGKCIYKI